MRLRRMLAFVLALAMVLGNVMPAYANENSGIETLSGDVTITTDENGNTVITPNSQQISEDGGELEDEGEEENQNGDESATDSTIEGESGNPLDGDNTDLPSEDDKTDSGTTLPEGEDDEVGESEEGVLPEEEVLPEESVSENNMIIEQSEITVGEDATVTLVEYGAEGSTEKGPFTSIPEAIAEINRLNSQTPVAESYEIRLGNDEYTIESTDERALVVNNDDVKCWININNKTINISNSMSCNVTFQANNSAAKGCIKLANGVEFQLLERIGSDEQIKMTYENVDFVGVGDNVTLTIGNEENDVKAEALFNKILFSNVILSGIQNLKIYENFEFSFGNGIENTNWNLENLIIDLDHEDEGFEEVNLSQVNIETDSLELHGRVYFGHIEDASKTMLSVTESTKITTGSSITVSGLCDLNNLTAIQGQEEEGSIRFQLLEKIQLDEGGNESSSIKADLNFRGALQNVSKPIIISAKKTISYADGRQAEIDEFESGEVIATIHNEDGNHPYDISKFEFLNSHVLRNNNQFVAQEIEGRIRLSDTKDSWYQYFENFEDVEAYMREQNQGSQRYKITLREDIEIENAVIDFSDCPAYDITLNLSGRRLEVSGESSIAVDNFQGGNVSLNADACLNIMPTNRRNSDDSNVEDLCFTFAEDASSWLVVGDGNTGSISLESCEIENGEKANVALHGDVSWKAPGLEEYWYRLFKKVDNAKEEFEKYELYIHNLVIQNEYTATTSNGKTEAIYDVVQMNIPVKVDRLVLDGTLNVASLDVTEEIEAVRGSAMEFHLPSVLSNVEILETDKVLYRPSALLISMRETYSNDSRDPVLYTKAELTVGGTIVSQKMPAMVFRKYASKVSVTSDYNIMETAYNVKSEYTQNDTVATLIPSWDNDSIRKISNYQIMDTASTSYSLDIVSDEQADNTYYLKACPEDVNNVGNKSVLVRDNEELKNHYFTTLKEARAFIVETIEEKQSVGNFTIKLLKNTSAGEKDLNYKDVTDLEGFEHIDELQGTIELLLNGNSITFSQSAEIFVDCLDGGQYTLQGTTGNWMLSKLGTFTLGSNRTLLLGGRKVGDGEEGVTVFHSKISNVNINGTGATLAVGVKNDDILQCSDMEFYNVGTNVKNLDVNGNLIWNGAAAVKVSTLMTVANEENQEVRWESAVTTAKLTCQKGNIAVRNFKSTSDANVTSGCSFVVLPSGIAEFKNLNVLQGEEGSSLVFALMKKEATGGKEETAALGNLKITGALKRNSKNPILVQKIDEAHGNVFFDNREDFANITSGIKAEDFELESPEGKTLFVRKYQNPQKGYCLQARIITVIVSHNGNEQPYIGLEEAIAGIATDFKSEKGTYEFNFLDDEVLNRKLTIPTCVTEAYFNTEKVEEYDAQEHPIKEGYVQKSLDFNRFSITTTAVVHMESGLRIKNGVFNINGTQSTLLFVNEETPLLDQNHNELIDTDEQGKVIADNREPVFCDITLNAKNGAVAFCGKTQEDFGKTTIITKELQLARGGMKVDSITATNLYIQAYQEYDNEGKPLEGTFEKANLKVNTITMNSGGRMEVYGIVGEFDQSPSGVWNEGNPDVILNGAKLYIGNNDQETAECYLNSLTVKSAYTGESAGDATVENEGQFFLATFDSKVGTMRNNGHMLVKDVKNVKDFVHGSEGSLIVDTWNQVSGSKTWLEGDSKLLINDSGTLFNINLGGKKGEGGYPFLGLGATKANGGAITTATIAIKGTFTKNHENQQLQIAATSSYSKIESLTDEMTVFNPTKEIYCLPATHKLFDTDHKSFPVEDISILPKKVPGGNEQGEAVEIDNPYGAAVQVIDAAKKINEVQVINEVITLHSIAADGYSREYMKNFTNWKDAMNYLTAVGNTNTQYVFELKGDKIDVGGALKLPTNVKSLMIAGDNATKPTTFTFTGNMDLTTDLYVENVKLPETVTMNTKGKMLTLKNVNGAIQTITGTAASYISICESDLELKKASAVSGIGTLELSRAILRVPKDVTVTKLVLQSTVANSRSRLVVAGKITVTDIDVYGQGNALHYANTVEIKGDLNSYSFHLNEAGRITGHYEDYGNAYADPVYTEMKDGKPVILGYTIEDDLNNVESSSYYKIIKKNATYLVYTGSSEVSEVTTLATTSKILGSWFVYDDFEYNTVEKTEKEGPYDIKNVTRKEGNIIKYGPKAIAKDAVELRVKGEPYNIDSYATLQEAFDEIERIANSGQSYEIILNKDVAADTNKDYKFPSKAANVAIMGVKQGEQDPKEQITFKSKMDIKCNTEFGGVTLNTTDAKGTLAINNFAVTLKDVKILDDVALTGGGIGKGSKLTVESAGLDEMLVNSIDKVDMLSMQNVDLFVSQKTTVGTLSMEDGTTLYGYGAIQATTVECLGDATVVTFPTGVKKDADGYITAMNPAFTISGKLDVVYNVEDDGETITNYGTLNIALGETFTVETTTGVDGNQKEIVTDRFANVVCYYENGANPSPIFAESLITANKAIIAKAPNVSTYDVCFEYEYGVLFKKAGNLVYKDACEVTTILSYCDGTLDAEGDEVYVETECESFADAVTEINTLKTKRDYTITFLQGDMDQPNTLTMPNANYVDTLYLTSVGGGNKESGYYNYDVYYVKDISFTSNVVLENISFVQVAQQKNEKGAVIPGAYEPIEDNQLGYPALVNVKSGNKSIFIGGDVTFNTPILLNGGGKGTLEFDDSTSLIASPTGYGESNLYIQGKVTGFLKVDINDYFMVDGWYTLKNGVETYNPCELNVTTLELGEAAIVTVGNSDTGTMNNVLKVTTELVMTDSDVEVYGTADLKNLTLAGEDPLLTVYGQKFNITGVLTSTALNPELVTTVNTKQQSVLNVSGTAVLEDKEENKIYIGLVDADGLPIQLGEEYIDENGEDKVRNNHLLTAAKVSETVFLVDALSTTDGDEAHFDVNSNVDCGYFLKKNGNNIEVYYADDVKVALCMDTEDSNITENTEYQVINYYKTLEEAVTAIKGLNDKNAFYRVLLLDSIGDEKTPCKMPIPENAKRVTFATLGNEYKTSVKLYNSNAITQKTDVVFENVEVITTGAWNTGNFNLELNNAKLTVNNKATVSNLILVDGGVLNTNNTTTLTNIENKITHIAKEEKDQVVNKVVTKAGTLTIKGNVTDVCEATKKPKLVLEAYDATEITEANIVNNKPENGKKYTLVTTAKLATLEKESMDKLDFIAVSNTEIKASATDRVVWASKGIYLVGINYQDDVNVVKSVKGDGENAVITPVSTTVCLDIAEAANYIKTVNEKSAYYDILLKNSVTDAKVTDTEKHSAITLPDKDKAVEVTLKSKESKYDLTFAKDVKVNGKVLIKDVALKNIGTYSISMEKNSDVKNGKEIIVGESVLTLDNVSMDRIVKDNVESNVLKSITGKKGYSDVIVKNTDVILSGAITNVVDFNLYNSKVETNAKSEVTTLLLSSDSVVVEDKTVKKVAAWETFAQATIGNVVLDRVAGDNYISTYYPVDTKDKTKNTGIPQLTVTGKVQGEGKLQVKIYDITTASRKEIIELNDNKQGYTGNKLLIAKAETGDKFIPYGVNRTLEGDKKVLNANAKATKDKTGYVSYVDITSMQVILSQKTAGVWNDSYVATYAEAIDIINNFGTKSDIYKITFRDIDVQKADGTLGADQKTDPHYTTIKDGKAAFGAFNLPKAGKADTLIIAGRGENESVVRTIVYTGAITANCNLQFENVILHEKDTKNTVTVNEVTLKNGNYLVDLSNNVKTERVSVDTATEKAFKASKLGFGDLDVTELQLIFKTIDGSKGKVNLGNTTTYVTGEIKVGELTVTGKPTVIGKNKITITDLVFTNDSASLNMTGEKAIAITNVNALYPETQQAREKKAALDITTYYTNKALAKSVSQFTISGEVHDDVAVNVKPMVYHDDKNDTATYQKYIPMNGTELETILIGAAAKPQSFQKVITAPKMVANDNVYIYQAVYNQNNAEYQWNKADVKAVKYEGALYFTKESFGVKVIGVKSGNIVDSNGDYIKDTNGEYLTTNIQVYAGQFFTWDQAVKEIDKLNHMDWIYDIQVLKDLGVDTPISSVTMPTKAQRVFIYGGKGILTTGNRISVKCDTTFTDISICAVKKTGNKYYGVPLTIDGSKWAMSLNNFRSDWNYENMGYYKAELILSGNANGKTEVRMSDSEGIDNGIETDLISQIGGIGTVVLYGARDNDANASKVCRYEIKNGIKSVKYLELAKGAKVDTLKSEVNVTNLTMGIADPRVENVSHSNSYLNAKNITVSGTTTMESGELRAGTTTVGDGKLTLTNVIFNDRHNKLTAKQDKAGKSLINIKGTVESTDQQSGWQAATITLYLNNSVQRKAQLVEDMVIMTAPKAPTSLFGPDYSHFSDNGTPDNPDDDYMDYQGMGEEITEDAIERDEQGNPLMGENDQPKTYQTRIYDFYKSGNDIKYGKVRRIANGNEVSLNEVRLWVGTKSLDGYGNTDETNAWSQVEKYDFKTFEEAVKAIDSMALYVDPNAKTKVFKDYTIELLNGVMIGNDKGDGKYSALSLPSKANEVTIWGNGMGIVFSGNITLKCNTTFKDVTMTPMKSVKGGAEVTTANLATGNFAASISNAVIGYRKSGEAISTLNTVSGSAKGSLILTDCSYMEVNSISGINVEFRGNGMDFVTDNTKTDDKGNPRKVPTTLVVNGNLTAKELRYSDYTFGVLVPNGKTVMDAIYVVGENQAAIQMVPNNPLQIKGITRTMEDKSKVNGSVFFDVVEVKDENGNVTGTLTTDQITVSLSSTNGKEIPSGTKVFTGKYLEPKHYDFYTYVDRYEANRVLYLNGNDLYLGGEAN